MESATHIKMVVVNGNGPALVIPKYFSLCRNPKIDVYHLRMAPLKHMVPVDEADCVLDHDCRGSLCECVNMIDAIQPDVIYAQDNGLYNVQIAPHLKVAFPDIPFIYEPYDTISSIYSDPELMMADGRSSEDVHFNVELERYLFSIADGVVHNDEGPQVRELIKRSSPHDLQVQAFVDEKDIHFYDRAEPHFPVRLVWAGGVAPTTAPDETRGENKLLPFFKALVAQGFDVSVYVALARDMAHLSQDYPDYLEFEAQAERFHMHPFMPRDALIRKISEEADFGLHIFPKPHEDTGRLAMYQSSMASKVMTYLAAGLPVITGDHLEPIARYVSGHNVGLVAKQGDAMEVSRCISDADYSILKESVKKHQSEIAVQAFIFRLEAFIRKIIPHNFQNGKNEMERGR